MSDFKDLHKFFGQQQQQHQQHPPLPLTQQQHQRAPDHHSSITGANPASLSNLFSDPFPENDFRSFSDLLAGAIATQLPGSGELNLGLDNWGGDNRGEKRDNNNNNNVNGGFKQNRPGSLVLPPVAPMFNVSPGLSPSAFLNSPTFLSPLGITPQQTLAHLTAQAALSQAHLNNIQPEHHTQHHHHNNHPPPSSSLASSAPTNTYQPSLFNTTTHHQHARVPPQSSNFPVAVDKPADDGYNWRKYGQKQVKGSEYPRSYYRCTTPNCPVKKKVERSFDGHITEIIYKGQHNHDRPQTGRRAKDGNSLLGGDWRDSYDNTTAQATSIQLNGPSDSEESGENYSENVDGDDDDNNDERKAKRRNGGGGQSEGGFTHRTMTEPKIVVQTRSDVDLLDDGYRWRKYGQKVVKGNPNPRSYYKCTTVGCKVRKHVERASTDPSAVITTYEGKHNHDVPATRGGGSINNTTNNNNVAANNPEATMLKVHNPVAQMNFGNTNNDQQPITLRLKEEQLIL